MGKNGKKIGQIVAMIVMMVIMSILLAGCSGSSYSYSGGSSSYSGSGSSYSSHECYVCGKSASQKVGSHWYCSTHAAMVRAASGN